MHSAVAVLRAFLQSMSACKSSSSSSTMIRSISGEEHSVGLIHWPGFALYYLPQPSRVSKHVLLLLTLKVNNSVPTLQVMSGINCLLQLLTALFPKH
jgi:hypothetical protein